MFKSKKVLVAGGTGMVGIQLVKTLIEECGATVLIASRDERSLAHPAAEFKQVDLTIAKNCQKVCRGMDYVFNLLCAKGSPGIVNRYPVTIMRPMLLFNTYLMDAAFRADVQGFLYTSSVGVYYPAEVLREDDVGKTPTPPNDRFAGGAKLVGEWYADAYRLEYGWPVTIVRPGNIYGPYDNFEGPNTTAVSALITRAIRSENPFVVWGDGSQIRDYVHSSDVARAMILVAQKGEGRTFNIASGIETTTRQLVETIVSNTNPQPALQWDITKPIGDKRRVLDITRLKSLGFEPKISLQEGIHTTMEWYRRNKNMTQERYDIFKK